MGGRSGKKYLLKFNWLRGVLIPRVNLAVAGWFVGRI
jgi:hypothetical protein